MELPAGLRGGIAEWGGGAAERWVEALPSVIEAAERRWGISVGRPYEPGGYTSYVAPAMTVSGVEVVYKCTIPHGEAVGEAEALFAYEGDGAVRLIESKPDTFELLLERCVPGTDLWSVDGDAERLDVATGLLGRLSRDIDGQDVTMLTSIGPQWADVTERRLVMSELPWVSGPIERGIDLLRALPFTAANGVLLHGDFHPGNILAAEREPWLVIDPKPIIGDPAFDPVQLLIQEAGRTTEPPEADVITKRLVTLADALGLAPERIGKWAIARCTEWSMWSFDHGNTVDAAIEYSWARTLDRIIPG